MYFDFLYKKFSEVFIRNVFVYTSQFFGEKYIIEVLTKKIIDNFIFNLNKFMNSNKLDYFVFFFQYFVFFFYFVSLINLYFIFFL